MFFRRDLSFKVKRGPISCKATFSSDRKAYLRYVNVLVCLGKDAFLPVSPEKEEIALIVEGDNLSPFKVGKRRKQSLEHATNSQP
jgi:hypothetical protein